MQTFGQLYTYYVIADSRKICPTVWHVSTDAEWIKLEKVVGESIKAGGKLKEGGLKHWKTPNKEKKSNRIFSFTRWRT